MIAPMLAMLRQFRGRFIGDARRIHSNSVCVRDCAARRSYWGAVDYSFGQPCRPKLQAGLDAAVLAGAKDGTDDWATVANNVFNGNVPVNLHLWSVADLHHRRGRGRHRNHLRYGSHASHKGRRDKVDPSHYQRRRVRANRVYDNSCILSLGTGQAVSANSITFNGAPNINLDQCTLRSNTSMRCNGHGGGSVASIAVGTVSGCSNPQPNSPVVPDVYEALATNITPSCGGARPAGTWTPGVPPAGITTSIRAATPSITSADDLTLSGSGFLTGSAPSSDSVIIVENGSLSMANNAAISTKRVAFVLTGNNSYASQINFPNGNGHAATLTLSPPTTQGNPWRGVSLYQRPGFDK